MKGLFVICHSQCQEGVVSNLCCVSKSGMGLSAGCPSVPAAWGVSSLKSLICHSPQAEKKRPPNNVASKGEVFANWDLVKHENTLGMLCKLWDLRSLNS